jgi:hypothetical protein
MQRTDSVQSTPSHTSARILKIEEAGDSWKGSIRPKIRLMGCWLERAGFKPSARVHVTCVAPGVIELRSPDAVMLNESKPVSSGPECPF